MINGPSTVQVFLRAGWSLGNVQDGYLFAGAGGDQLVGRTLSGLPFNDSTFATLPPHFNQEGARLISWEPILPMYSKLPECFKQALPHLLASVIYHEDWLRSTLPLHHPLFSSHLFASGTVTTLKQHLLTGSGRCASTGMIATGIPPHLVMTNELTAVVSRTEQLKQALLTRCDKLPAEVTDVMLSKFSINGAIPVTMDNMKDMLDTVITQLRTEIRTQATETHTMPPLIAPSIDSRFQLWAWGGKLHMVPEGWIFPSTNVKDTWNLWHFGHLADRIRPLRYLKKYDLGSKAQVTVWSKTRGVMQAISQVIVDMQLVQAVEAVLVLNAADSSTLFDQAIVALMDQLRAESTREKRRWMEMSVPTMYALVLKDRYRRKRRREEEEEGRRGEEEKQEEEEEEKEREGEEEKEEEREEEDQAHRAGMEVEVDASRRGGREEGEAAFAVALLSQAFGGAL